MPEERSRYLGSLLGLAVGDALGTALEFRSPGSFEPISDMKGGGPFGLPPGYWTDDTSMALCLAASLIEAGSFDPEDQMNRYLRWYREGYLSSTGSCFDIGNTVRDALERYQKEGNPWAGSTHPRTAGNGSIMRLAPVPLLYRRYPERAIEMSGQSSLTTHGAREAVDACRYFGGLIAAAASGVDKETLLSPRFAPAEDYWKVHRLAPEIDRVALGSFKSKSPPDIRGTGYVVKSLEAALWALHHARDYREGCLMAVNLGDDADTTGAVFGQLAGALWGAESIPVSWLKALHMRATLERTALSLHDLSCCLPEAFLGSEF